MPILDRVDFLDISVYGVDNDKGGSTLKIDIQIIPKEDLSDEYKDLHDIFSRIQKFACTELELYSDYKMKQERK